MLAILQQKCSRYWPWLALVLIILFVASIRGRLREMPLERDEGEYAYAGQLILQGIPPYQLAYNMKLPGTYYVLAAGMAVFGQTTAGVHLTLLAANSLTILFIFLLGRALLGSPTGVVAAASYGLLSMSPVVLGMAAHANHFVLLFAVPATLLLWQARKLNRPVTIFLAGALYGTACVMKQQALFFCLFGGLALAWCKMRDEAISWRSLIKAGFAYGFGLAVPLGLTCLLMWWSGVFPKFWFWTFTYARNYATSTSMGEGLGNLATFLDTPLHLHVLFGFWTLAVVGLLLAARTKAIQNQMIYLIGFALFSLCATATGFYFRKHYFVLMLPALAICVGMAGQLIFQWLQTRTTSRATCIIPAGLIVTVLAWNVFIQSDVFFHLTPEEATQAAYIDEHFAESIVVGRYIAEHSATNATVAVMGSEPQIYFYARRHSATGYIYTYALMEAHPHAATMQREMEQEIETSQPEFLVDVGYNYSWIVRPTSDRGIFRWFDEYAAKHYERVGIIDSPPTRPTRYLWGDEAKNYHGQVAQYMAIYRRKPASAH